MGAAAEELAEVAVGPSREGEVVLKAWWCLREARVLLLARRARRDFKSLPAAPAGAGKDQTTQSDENQRLGFSASELGCI